MRYIYSSIAFAVLFVVTSFAYAENGSLSSQESGQLELERSLQQRRVGIAHTSVGISTGTLGLGLGIAAIATTMSIDRNGGDLYAMPLVMGITSAVLLTASIVFTTVGARMWSRGGRQAARLRMAARLPSFTISRNRSTSAYSFGLSMLF